MQKIVMLTSRVTLVILAFLMLRQTLTKSNFSAGIPNKEGETCYAVKHTQNNNIYQGSRLFSGLEVHLVEAWNTPNFNEGQCDPGEKVTIKQYTVESKFEPTEQKLRFRVYESGILAREEVWNISSDGKTNYRLSAYSNQKLTSTNPEIEIPSLGEIATNQR